MIIRRKVVGELDSNCYVAKEGSDSFIVDPGGNPDDILSEVENLTVKWILITHGHFDHTGGLQKVKEETGAPSYIHHADYNADCDEELSDGDSFTFGSNEIKVIHTPGHTPGSCCFHIDNYLFSGDTIFPGGPGNTSLPGGDEIEIYESIREKIIVLPDETIILPGHGPRTTVGREKKLYL